MNVDGWLLYYHALPGYSIAIEGEPPAWCARDEDGKLVDWWLLDQMGATRPITDPLTPPTDAPMRG